MKTRFEIRRPDLSGIFITFDYENEAISWWKENVWMAPQDDYRHGAVVVRHTFESAREAETARLDFLLKPGGIAAFFAIDQEATKMLQTDESGWLVAARYFIDQARKAPAPEVVVIWPKKP